MRTKEDRRTLYSKKVIRDTLISLLKEKDLDSITISEICDVAEINRGTFYHYYKDIYDLVSQIIEYDMKNIDTLLSKFKPFEDNKHIFVDELLSQCELRKDILFLKISPSIVGDYQNKLCVTVKPHVIKYLDIRYPEMTDDRKIALSVYFIAGISAYIMTWLVGHKNVSREEVKNNVLYLMESFTNLQ